MNRLINFSEYTGHFGELKKITLQNLEITENTLLTKDSEPIIYSKNELIDLLHEQKSGNIDDEDILDLDIITAQQTLKERKILERETQKRGLIIESVLRILTDSFEHIESSLPKLDEESRSIVFQNIQEKLIPQYSLINIQESEPAAIGTTEITSQSIIEEVNSSKDKVEKVTPEDQLYNLDEDLLINIESEVEKDIKNEIEEYLKIKINGDKNIENNTNKSLKDIINRYKKEYLSSPDLVPIEAKTLFNYNLSKWIYEIYAEKLIDIYKLTNDSKLLKEIGNKLFSIVNAEINRSLIVDAVPRKIYKIAKHEKRVLNLQEKKILKKDSDVKVYTAEARCFFQLFGDLAIAERDDLINKIIVSDSKTCGDIKILNKDNNEEYILIEIKTSSQYENNSYVLQPYDRYIEFIEWKAVRDLYYKELQSQLISQAEKFKRCKNNDNKIFDIRFLYTPQFEKETYKKISKQKWYNPEGLDNVIKYLENCFDKDFNNSQ